MDITMWATTALLFILTMTSLVQGDGLRHRYTRTASSSIASLSWAAQFNSGRRLKVPHGVASHVHKRYAILGEYKPDQAYQACIMPGEHPGRCRHLQYCVLEDFRTSFPRFLDYLCIIERSFVGVCCPDRPADEPGGFLPLASPNVLQPTSGRQLSAAQRTANTADDTPANLAAKPRPRGCGVNSKADIRDVGTGSATDPKEWPWMAALLREGYIHFCGGVLVSDRHVLTAAHCVTSFQAGDILVRLGEYNFETPTETRFRDFQVTNVKQHEEFQDANYENDIAILKLHRPATFNTYIWPICLPPPGESFENQTATVIGWGSVYFGGPVSRVLLEVSVPVWNNSECDSKYTQTIFDTNLCAGLPEGGKDACQGDSGGPLLFQLPNKRWTTIGVVSWGIRCGNPDRPGIYTRVNRYLDWIAKNTVL